MKAFATALPLLAFVGVLAMTRAPGPILCPDSASYLSASESLAHWQAPRAPFAEWFDRDSSSRLKHFPPGFPALAAVPTALGLGAAQGARLIDALAAAATVALVALAAARAAGMAAGCLAAAMVMLTPAIAQVHAFVLSEPVFLALVALLLVLMMRAPKRALLLGLVAAAAVMVRYAGVAWVAAAALWMLLQSGGPSVRLRRASIALLPPIAALGAWRFWTGGFRSYGYKPGLSTNLASAWQTFTELLAPALDPSGARSAIALAVFSGVVLVLRAQARPRAESADEEMATQSSLLLRASGLMVICYLAVVVTSRLYADPDIPFDWRLLSPVVLLTEVSFVVALVRIWPGWRWALRGLSAATLALWLVGSSWTLLKFAIQARTQGWGYEAVEWQRSELALWLRADGRHYQLYSNDPTAIWHLAHRASRLLPRSDDPVTLRRFAAELRLKPSAVLGFADPLMPTVLPSSLATRLALPRPARLDKASVWLSAM